MILMTKVSKGAKIRNRYNQVPHLTQDTNGKVTNSQLDTTNESQEVNPIPAGDQKAQKPDAHKGITNTRQKNINDPWNCQSKYFIQAFFIASKYGNEDWSQVLAT